MLCRSGKCSGIAMEIHVTCWNTASSYGTSFVGGLEDG